MKKSQLKKLIKEEVFKLFKENTNVTPEPMSADVAVDIVEYYLETLPIEDFMYEDEDGKYLDNPLGKTPSRWSHDDLVRLYLEKNYSEWLDKMEDDASFYQYVKEFEDITINSNEFNRKYKRFVDNFIDDLRYDLNN
jgi:hypothetical protein